MAAQEGVYMHQPQVEDDTDALVDIHESGEVVPHSELLPPGPYDELDLMRGMVAEFLGSFFLISLVLGAVYVSGHLTKDVVTIERALLICLAYGFAYAACIYSFSFPSRDRRVLSNIRHLNPAVTFALLASFKISLGRGLLYVLSQITGGSMAALCIYYCTPFATDFVVLSTYPLAEGVNEGEQTVMCLMLSYTFLLVLLITSFGHLSRKQPTVAAPVEEESPQTYHEINSIIAGCAALVCSAAGGPVTGGYVNPLFPLSIGILSGTYKLIPALVPFAGGVLAVLTGVIFGFKIELFKQQQ